METPKNKKKCPKCVTGMLTMRARRPLLVKTVLFWLPIKRYQCNVCDRKTYVYGNASQEVASAELA